MQSEIVFYLRKLYKEELQFYQYYHRNSTNILIHKITIPLEWVSWLLILRIIHLNWYVSFSISIYYLIINSKMSYYASFAQILSAITSDIIYNNMDIVNSLCISLFLQCVCWLVQVHIGHFLFEKNSPAMVTKLTLNSILLSYLMAWEDII